MIVVADASPLNYLVQLQREALLERLYGQVMIPTGVFSELLAEKAPPAVAEWARRLPAWVSVHSVPPWTESDLEGLGTGEREAIALALAKGADLLLVDDRLGRAEAERRGIPTTGVLGILLAAGKRAMINAEEEFLRLISTTNFRVAEHIRRDFLSAARELRGD